MANFINGIIKCDDVQTVKGCHFAITMKGKVRLDNAFSMLPDIPIDAIQIGFTPGRAYIITYAEHIHKCCFSTFLRSKMSVTPDTTRVLLCRDEKSMIIQALACLRQNKFQVLYGYNGRKAVSYFLNRAEKAYHIYQEFPEEFHHILNLSANSPNGLFRLITEPEIQTVNNFYGFYYNY
jgi:hypothetical protein